MRFLKEFFNMEKGTLEELTNEKYKTLEPALRFLKKNLGTMNLLLGIPAAMYVKSAFEESIQNINEWRALTGVKDISLNGLDGILGTEASAWIMGTATIAAISLSYNFLARKGYIQLIKKSQNVKKRENYMTRSVKQFLPLILPVIAASKLTNVQNFMQHTASELSHPRITELTTEISSNLDNAILYSAPILYLVGKSLVNNVGALNSGLTNFKNYFNQTSHASTTWFKKIAMLTMSKKSYDKLRSTTKKYNDDPAQHTNRSIKQKFYEVYYQTNPIKKHELLENYLSKIKSEQYSSEMYLKDKDVDLALRIFGDEKSIDLVLYGAALLEKDAPQVSKNIVNKLSERDNFFEQSTIALYKSIFGHTLTNSELQQLIEGVKSGKGERNIFVGSEKIAEQYFDGEVWRVWKHSKDSFSKQYMVEKDLFQKLTNVPNITTEFSIFYLDNVLENHSLSLRLKGESLDQSLKNSHDQELKLTDTLVKANKYLDTLNELDEITLTEIRTFNLKNNLERRMFGSNNRFIKTPDIQKIANIVSGKMDSYFKGQRLTYIDADLSDQNTFYDTTSNYYSFFDPRLYKGIPSIAITKLIAQTNTDLPLKRKINLIKDATGMDNASTNLTMFYHLLCEAGSDIGHDRYNHSLHKKINNLLELSSEFDFGDDFKEYIQNNNYST